MISGDVAAPRLQVGYKLFMGEQRCYYYNTHHLWPIYVLHCRLITAGQTSKVYCCIINSFDVLLLLPLFHCSAARSWAD